jgi:CIC family chloride channel protein
VGRAMTRGFPTVPPTMPVAELLIQLRDTGHHGFPVVDKYGNLLGMVTLSDIEAMMAKGDVSDLTVGDIASKSIVVAYPDEYVHDVFVRLGTREVGRIPVVDRNKPERLLGVLQRQDVLIAYATAIRRQPRR